MLKLIHADLYKTFRRPLFYVFLMGMAVLAVSVNLSISRMATVEARTVTSSWGVVLAYFLSWPMLLMPVLVDLVSAEEYKEHTLKNSVASGLNRTKLYLSKAATATVLGVVLGVVALGAYCGSSLLLLRWDPAFTAAFAADFFRRVGVSCIGYAAAIPLAAFLAMLLQKNSLFVFAYYGALVLPQLLLQIAHVPELSGVFLMMPQFNRIAAGSISQMQVSAAVFAVTAFVFLLSGVLLFRKKDIC